MEGDVAIAGVAEAVEVVVRALTPNSDCFAIFAKDHKALLLYRYTL